MEETLPVPPPGPPLRWGHGLRQGSALRTRDQRRLLCAALVQILDGLANRLDALGLLVGDGSTELFFKGHDELNQVQRIGAQILAEARLRNNLGRVYAQLIHDNLFHTLENSHVRYPLWENKATARV